MAAEPLLYFFFCFRIAGHDWPPTGNMQFANMSIDPKIVELTADVLRIFLCSGREATTDLENNVPARNLLS